MCLYLAFPLSLADGFVHTLQLLSKHVLPVGVLFHSELESLQVVALALNGRFEETDLPLVGLEAAHAGFVQGVVALLLEGEGFAFQQAVGSQLDQCLRVVE